MKCNFCQAELEKGMTVCPACGKEAVPAKKKMTSGKLAVIYICIIVLLATVAAFVLVGINNGVFDKKTNKPTGNVFFADTGKNDVTCQGSYTVSDRKAKSKADKVIATAGDAELTNSMLQSIYWLQVYNYTSSYSGYGLDTDLPLDQQMCSVSEGNWSWQQYFLNVALNEWQLYNAFCQEAKAVGFESTMDVEAMIAEVRTNMEKNAVDQGFASADELLYNDMGPAASVDAYLKFLELTERAYDYYESVYMNLVPTADEVRTYFEENADMFAENGVFENGSTLIDVRHILLQPADKANEQDWQDCEKQAQDLLDQWLAGAADEDSFAALANEHSADGGSNTNGGLYQYVRKGQMVQEFNDWCFDEARQYGDYGLVKTTHGYHLMFFVKSQPTWFVYAESTLKNEMANDVMEALVEKYPIEVDYDKIVLGEPVPATEE